MTGGRGLGLSAQDMDNCWAVVYTVMNLGVTFNPVYFLAT